MTDLIGHTIGQYQIVERIGKGGMADVYKAYQPALERYVAIKVLPEYFIRDETFLVRFEREAKAVARLSHPHILPVYDFGQQDNLTYIVMQYVEAGTLKDMLGQPLDLNLAADIIDQVADALNYAHEQGIIHRDVKPSNVLMERGRRAMLTDFGLAKMTEATVQLTGSGVGVGTPDYMSPEQGQGVSVDARSDVYSLGVVLYEMLTGRVPYEAETPMAVVLKHITAPLPLPGKVNPAIPEVVERVILKALAKDPADRYRSAGELAEALKKAAGVMEEAAPVAVPMGKAVPFWRRVPLWAWGAVGGVVLLLVVGGVLLGGPEPVRVVLAPPTATPTNTWTPTPLPTDTPTATPTDTLTPTPYPTFTPVPTDTPLPPTPTATLTPTCTPEPTPTNTPEPTPTDTPLPPTPTPSPVPYVGRIAFYSDRDGKSGIYVMNADGSGVTYLRIGFDPAWSPDGTRIAGNGIDVMNADGSGRTRLTNISAWHPTWSPDGTRMAFYSNRDGRWDIYVMNADGSGVTNLTNRPTGGDTHPTWSPDGTRIAFTCYNSLTSYEICVMNADGSGRTNLTNHPDADEAPAWSPDSTRIAFESHRDGNWEIYVMDADGSGVTRLTDNSTYDGRPTWSPDGRYIAFERHWEIYVMNADGSGQTNLTNHPASDGSPSWGP